VVASGSLPSGVPDDFYARLLRQVRDTGARFIHDTSGAPLALALDVGVYLVKPNRHEFAELTGADPENVADLERAAQDLVRRGRAEIVALTLGAQGALMVARTAVQRIAPPQVRAIGTIGAGDSFLGAMTFALARNWPHGESFRLAVAAGTAALTMPGTKLCQRDDVMAFYRDLGGTFARLDRP
jgi:6-phosphofructokinase 2